MNAPYLDARIDECLMALLLLRQLLPLALERNEGAARTTAGRSTPASRADSGSEARAAWGLAEEPRTAD